MQRDGVSGQEPEAKGLEPIRTTFMKIAFCFCLCASVVVLAQTPVDNKAVLADLQKIAALPGEPLAVSAGGVTRSEQPLYTIENPNPFAASEQRRVVIVGGLDGDVRGAEAALGAVAWFKTRAPSSVRRDWAISALPFADPDQHARARAFQFPPQKGFFDDAEQPESRYVWRWVNFQAPDLVLEIRGGDSMSWQGSGLPSLKGSDVPRDGLAAALSTASDLGAPAPALVVTAGAADGPQLLQKALAAASALRRSPLHAALAARVARKPLEIARVLAQKYPQTPIVSYIPSVAWTNTLRLAALTNDPALRARVLEQTSHWLSD